MRRSLIRPLALGCALMLSSLTVACSAGTVAPLPVRTASPGSGAVGDVPAAATSSPDATEPEETEPEETEPEAESACMGAVVHELEVESAELIFAHSDCMEVGGVLRLRGVDPNHPDMVTVKPESHVTQNYAAGVLDIRFTRKGTVDVRIRLEGTVHTLTMVII